MANMLQPTLEEVEPITIKSIEPSSKESKSKIDSKESKRTVKSKSTLNRQKEKVKGSKKT